MGCRADFIYRLGRRAVEESVIPKTASMPILFAATRVDQLSALTSNKSSRVEPIDVHAIYRDHQPLLDLAALFEPTLKKFIAAVQRINEVGPSLIITHPPTSF